MQGTRLEVFVCHSAKYVYDFKTRNGLTKHGYGIIEKRWEIRSRREREAAKSHCYSASRYQWFNIRKTTRTTANKLKLYKNEMSVQIWWNDFDLNNRQLHNSAKEEHITVCSEFYFKEL